MQKNNGTEWVQIIANLAFLCAVGVVSYGLVNQEHIWSRVFFVFPILMILALIANNLSLRHLFAFSAVAMFMVGGMIQPFDIGPIRNSLILIPLCYIVLFPGTLWPIAVGGALVNGYLYQLTATDLQLFIEVASEVSVITVFATFMAYFYVKVREQAMAYKQESVTDYLTKLPNLNAFYSDIKQVNKANAEYFGLLHIGLDGFKNVNDRLGYRHGDVLLVAFANHINDLVGGYGKLYRLGGDEFVLMAESHDIELVLDETIEILHRHKKTLFNVNSTSHRLGFCIGVAFAKDAVDNLDIWVKNSDFALFKARSEGAGSVCWFDDKLLGETIRQHQIETEIKDALINDQFVLYYQPKVSATTSEVVGAEALIRWNHPQLGAITPAEFIPVAERTAQIVPLGHWVLREACKQIKEWHDAGVDLCVSVNVSNVQFDHTDLFKVICEILREVRLPSHLLQIEITESALMGDPDAVTDICGQLRALGISVAIDDFGVEYSCLRYLKKLPVDVLKIDKCFVDECAIHEADRMLLRTIVQMGHSLNIKVVAEGVEDEQQLEVLRQENCDEYQGYLFSQPLCGKEFFSLFNVSSGASKASA
ncbi:putative bifunctional diguanylate cyclase/phosphodiesterase [Vibrio sp. T11.5]|uniref:putative bifunctional diguanylate cyclase/phosphodiesterase n=1 Tax=Vibrio sp. T11.5 TaxID=2998836 RepID=UPI0022CD8ABF|nr:bifunctional diguanylate cyclase/phosphodiesterase [Vibrio sp. T11.5]MDA0116708.1 bifunctional diguanylate cyclase/phosphodiesterase [Vibrio sp. T11.5]